MVGADFFGFVGFIDVCGIFIRNFPILLKAFGLFWLVLCVIGYISIKFFGTFELVAESILVCAREDCSLWHLLLLVIFTYLGQQKKKSDRVKLISFASDCIK